MDSTLDDISERGSAMMDAAQDAYGSIEETLEDVDHAAAARDRRHRARHRLPDRRGLAPLGRTIGLEGHDGLAAVTGW